MTLVTPRHLAIGLLLVLLPTCQSDRERRHQRAMNDQRVMQGLQSGWDRERIQQAREILGEGRCQQALDLLDDRLARPPYLDPYADGANYLQVHLLRSRALICLDRSVEALEILDDLLSRQTLIRDAAADEGAVRSMLLTDRSNAYLQSSQPRAALISAEAAIRASPELPNGHLARGRALEALGMDAEAIRSYQAVLLFSTGRQRDPTMVGYAQERLRALEGAQRR